MKYELICNTATTLFGILSNNWISVIIALVVLCYNLYNHKIHKYNFSIIIDDNKDNVKESNKISLTYKVKFLIYVIISIYGMCIAILDIFDEIEFMDKFKIF